MAAFDNMDLGDRAQLQFICEKDTATRNLILATLGQPQGSAGALMTGTVVDIFLPHPPIHPQQGPKVFPLEKRQGLDHGHTPGRFRGVFGVPTGRVGQQVHGLLARAQHS